MPTPVEAEAAQDDSAPLLEPLLLTSAEACRVLGIGSSKFWTLCGKGKIRRVKVGKRLMVDYAALKKSISNGGIS